MTAFPKPEGRDRDERYLAFVRSLPCYVAAVALPAELERIAAIANPEECAAAWEDFHAIEAAWECEGRVEADHQGDHPWGRKADDRTAVPMCWKHHRARTNPSGWSKVPDIYSALTQEQRRAQRMEAIRWTQDRHADAEEAARGEI